jgi:hypothetical protein
MPTNAVLFPQSVCPDVAKGSARGNIASTGGLGAIYAPFIPGAGGQAQKNMQMRIPRDQLDDRRRLLASFNRLAQERDRSDSMLDRYHEQAYRLLLGRSVANALDLSRESPRIVARYDTSRYARSDGWSKAQRGKRGYYNRTRPLPGQAPAAGAAAV